MDCKGSVSHLQIYRIETVNFIKMHNVFEVPANHYIGVYYCCNGNVPGIVFILWSYNVPL